MSIYSRLFLWFCAVNILTLAASILIAHAIFERREDRAPDIAPLAREVQRTLERGETLARQPRDGAQRWYLLRNGYPLTREPLPPPLRRHLDALLAEDTELRLPRGVWLASQRLAAPHADLVLLVVQGAPRRAPEARWLAPALQVLLSVLAIGVVGWIVAGHLARPLARIQTVTRRMAAGELSSRVGAPMTARADEYGALARDFDRMGEQIETLVSQRDRLLHDVSHELRAPLSRLRFALELARGEAGDKASGDALDRADREIGRIDVLVGELLALARLDRAAAEAALPSVDLAALAREVVDAETPLARHAGVNMHLHADSLRARGDEESLRRALENLLRNALRHAPAASTVHIGVNADGGDALLHVRDQGPGVSAEELPRLFEPFFRGAAAREHEGHGLGLAIVARVMRAHGGQARASLAPGGGLLVELRWPRA